MVEADAAKIGVDLFELESLAHLRTGGDLDAAGADGLVGLRGVEAGDHGEVTVGRQARGFDWTPAEDDSLQGRQVHPQVGQLLVQTPVGHVELSRLALRLPHIAVRDDAVVFVDRTENLIANLKQS